MEAVVPGARPAILGLAALVLVAFGCGAGDAGSQSAAYQKCFDFAQTRDMIRFPIDRAAAEAGVSDLAECERGINAALGIRGDIEGGGSGASEPDTTSEADYDEAAIAAQSVADLVPAYVDATCAAMRVADPEVSKEALDIIARNMLGPPVLVPSRPKAKRVVAFIAVNYC